MGDAVKTLLSTSIKVLEQGAFQEFCLQYLPLFDGKFLSLERHGGTADGKTRAGTPDLIKTHPDGSHTCVQCSVEKDYWQKPTNIEEWKPIQDIIKCVKNVSNISEIVLCSSQEIPTNQPNIKSEILQQSKKFLHDAQTEILSLSNFEEEIRSHLLKYSELLKKFCPDLFEYMSSFSDKAAAEAKVNLYKKWPVPFKLIDGLVEEHCKKSLEGIDISKVELEIARICKSRFQRITFVDTNRIHRASISEFLMKNKIHNSIYTMIGVPKIGKTSWVLQLSSEVEKSGIQIIWFDVPYQESEQDDFWQDFQRIFLSELIGIEVVNQYIDKKFGMEEVGNLLLNSSNRDKKLLIVIDNIERLSGNKLKSFKELMNLIRTVLPSNNIGIMLISNRNLKSYIGNIATEIYCPSWKKEELSQLLSLTGIEVKNDVNKYCELLETFSGGHPLVAIALARKAPTIGELLIIKFGATPSLYDEDLTAETKALLFDDILNNADVRELVLRLSILFSRFDLNLMNYIATNIQPILGTPAKLIFDNLQGTVIEGDDKVGYQVAFLFKEIASGYLTLEQKREIYDRIGTYLITPRANVIRGEDVLDAIMYALAAGNLEKVFSWTGLLIYFTGKEHATKEQYKYLLSRLGVIEAINFPIKKELHLVHSIVLFGFAQFYNAIDDLTKANEILMKLTNNPIKMDDLPTKSYPKFKGLGGQRFSAEMMNTGIRIYLILNLLITEDYTFALQLLNQCDIKILGSFIELFSESGGLVHLLIQKGTLETFPKNLVRALIDNASFKSGVLLFDLAACFTSLGVIAHNEKKYLLMQDILSKDIENNNFKWKLLSKFSFAQYELESKNARKTLNITEDILKSAEKIGIESNKFRSEIQIMRGDAFYQLEEYKNAYEAYNLALKVVKDETKSFKYSWVNYKMGLSTEDYLVAIEHFEKACVTFNDAGLLKLKAKSEGEKAVALYQSGKVKDAFHILVALADNYYLNNLPDYGPSTAVALSASSRLRYELEGLPLDQPEDGRVFVKLEKGVFDKILDIAKPEEGICTAYLMFGQVFKLLEEGQQQKKYLQLVFESAPLTEHDKSSKLLAGFDLIELYIEEVSDDNVKKVVSALFSESFNYGFLKKKLLLHYIFPKLDSVLKNGILSRNRYIYILETAEKSINLSVEEAKRNFLLADLYMRKAGIDGITQEKDYNSDLLLKAWDCAIKSTNYDVLRDTGYQLGFKFYAVFKSFQKIAEVQLSIILGICNDGGDITRLEIVGRHLKNFWNVISFRRLSETDLLYWKNIRDRTRNIVAESRENIHAPLLVLFLLIANGVESEAAFVNARVWATDILKNSLNQLPADEYEYIKHLF
ncbi:MAG: AAA family ATPase [Thermodesulfovibrionales bacterium]